MRCRALLLVVAAAVNLACQLAPPPRPKASFKGTSDFTRSDQFHHVRLSPKGSYAGAINASGDLVFFDLRTQGPSSSFRPGAAKVLDFHWANDTRVLVEIGAVSGALAAPVNEGELYSIDASGANGKMIFGPRSWAVKERQEAKGAFQSRLRGDERRVLIAVRALGGPADAPTTLEKLDVYTGQRTQITSSPAPGVAFLSDEDGDPRLAIGEDERVGRRAFYRDPGKPWTPLPLLQATADTPLSFVDARRSVLVSSESPDGGFEIAELSLDTGARTTLARSEQVPSYPLFDSATQRPYALLEELDRPVYDFLDKEHPLSRMLKKLLGEFPGLGVRLLNTTDNQQQALIEVYGDRDPGRYLLVDVRSGVETDLVVTRSWIEAAEMAPKSGLHLRASDGMPIHGYLTAPATPVAGALPPLVVLLHGGPHWVRDTWGFDPDVQLLARNGFAVLQVNFRGSGGYGNKYQVAGYHHWGDRMIQDIVDATREMIRQGQVDPQRICVFGISYGGYAALQSALLAPDLFRCAIGYSGTYDVAQIAEETETREVRLGRVPLRKALDNDRKLLEAVSPFRRAAPLEAPVMLVHGRKDPLAPIEDAERLKAALEQAGHPVEWWIESKEGSGFNDDDARLRMYDQALWFLLEHTQPVPAGPVTAR
jgi:dienelactone hydrolase